jgi:hypothetical protein
MTAKEKLANRHLTATAKVTHGGTNVAAQEKDKKQPNTFAKLFVWDREVLELARDGVNALVQRTAQRIRPLIPMSRTQPQP